MSVMEACDIQCASPSVLNDTVENVIEALLNHEQEVQLFDQRKAGLDIDIDTRKKELQELEVQKDELEAQITTLKLRNTVHQKEHTNLRNAITVVRYQIEKIKESIEKSKARELKDLEEFEREVDEITEKFRSGRSIYERSAVLKRIAEAKEENILLEEKLKELTNAYAEFNQENGLRARNDETEALIDCILPGSKLFSLIEMTKILDEVICGIKKFIADAEQDEEELIWAFDY